MDLTSQHWFRATGTGCDDPLAAEAPMLATPISRQAELGSGQKRGEIRPPDRQFPDRQFPDRQFPGRQFPDRCCVLAPRCIWGGPGIERFSR